MKQYDLLILQTKRRCTLWFTTSVKFLLNNTIKYVNRINYYRGILASYLFAIFPTRMKSQTQITFAPITNLNDLNYTYLPYTIYSIFTIAFLNYCSRVEMHSRLLTTAYFISLFYSNSAEFQPFFTALARFNIFREAQKVRTFSTQLRSNEFLFSDEVSLE
jgi:hypothetical protein